MPNEIVSAGAKGLTSIVGDFYRDLAQPSVRQVGLSLEAVTRVVVSPVELLTWGFERSKEWLKEKVGARLSSTPTEYIIQPTDSIVSAALSHIAQSNDVPELRELYAELLLKAMDSRTCGGVHPAYFHILEQLAPEEALVLIGLHALAKEPLFQEEITPYGSYGTPPPDTIEGQFASFCASVLARNSAQPDIWLINLCRLGLLTLQAFGEAIYREAEHNKDGFRPPNIDNHEHRIVSFTPFGKAFIRCCAPPAAPFENDQS